MSVTVYDKWQNPIASGVTVQAVVLANKSKMRDANLCNTDFTGLNLSGADFFGALVDYCNFSDSNLSGCDFTHASMVGVTFSGTTQFWSTIGFCSNAQAYSGVDF